MSDALAPVPAPDLSHLYDVADEARAYAAHARAPATRRAYASDWRAFAGWCQQQAVSALPAPPAAVALYLTETARRCKVATHWRESAAEHGQLDTRKGRRGDIMELISEDV